MESKQTNDGISIVVSTYGRQAEIKKLIHSIQENFPEGEFEIIIVSSDSPSSEKITWLKNHPNTVVLNPDVRTGKRTKSLYYYENMGIREASKEFILVINDDMSFDNSFYPEFLKWVDNDIIYLKTHLAQVSLGTRLPIIGTYKTPNLSEGNLYLLDFLVCKKEVYEKIGFLDENIDWFGKGADLALIFAFSKENFKVCKENNLYLNHSISSENRNSHTTQNGSSTYHKYIEQKWRKFCEQNPGYDFKIKWG